MTHMPLAMSSHAASALHSRLASRTLQARLDRDRAPVRARRTPRVSEAAVWKLMNSLRASTALADTALPLDRAVRRILADLLAGARSRQRLAALPPCTGPALVIRSGPWPVLHTLVAGLAAAGGCTGIAVVCHKRDRALIEAAAASIDVPIEPCYYPRFEPFSPVTLKRVMTEHRKRWRATFLLDGSRSGTGEQLEHMASAFDGHPGPAYVWNASGELYRMLRLRETLGPEAYELVRRLLRWHAGQMACERESAIRN